MDVQTMLFFGVPSALREDLYYDVGCLLSLSLVHGGPPLGFFSKALYQCLFNYPRDSPLSLDDMGDTRFARKVREVRFELLLSAVLRSSGMFVSCTPWLL